MNVMAHSQKERREAMMLGLDGEQAFDLLSWEFLFHVLDKFGFGSTFINYIRVLYSSPRALVRVN